MASVGKMVAVGEEMATACATGGIDQGKASPASCMVTPVQPARINMAIMNAKKNLIVPGNADARCMPVTTQVFTRRKSSSRETLVVILPHYRARIGPPTR
jgi:hypothetical protein